MSGERDRRASEEAKERQNAFPAELLFARPPSLGLQKLRLPKNVNRQAHAKYLGKTSAKTQTYW
jgi:hypothetical protein